MTNQDTGEVVAPSPHDDVLSTQELELARHLEETEGIETASVSLSYVDGGEQIAANTVVITGGPDAEAIREQVAQVLAEYVENLAGQYITVVDEAGNLLE